MTFTIMVLGDCRSPQYRESIDHKGASTLRSGVGLAAGAGAATAIAKQKVVLAWCLYHRGREATVKDKWQKRGEQ